MTPLDLGRQLARLRKAAGLTGPAAGALRQPPLSRQAIDREEHAEISVPRLLKAVEAYRGLLVLVAAEGPLSEGELAALERLLRRLRGMAPDWPWQWRSDGKLVHVAVNEDGEVKVTEMPDVPKEGKAP